MNNGFLGAVKMLRGLMYSMRFYSLIFVLISSCFSAYSEPIGELDQTIRDMNAVSTLLSSYSIYIKGGVRGYEWYVGEFLLMRKFEILRLVKDNPSLLNDQARFVYAGLELYKKISIQNDCKHKKKLNFLKYLIINTYNNLDSYGQYRFGLYFYNQEDELKRSLFEPQKIYELDELIKDSLLQTANAKLALMNALGTTLIIK